MLRRNAADGAYPILRERTPVRLDLTHSAWSDIFFLGMDYPEGAKVLNISIDLGVHDRPHASSALEWWYVNAQLETAAGRRYGVFAAFFRQATGRTLSGETEYAHSLAWALTDRLVRNRWLKQQGALPQKDKRSRRP